jgi:shikimate kinase
MKIFLIGLLGSGKTTLGKQLAAELDIPFVDLDWEIEKKENKSVREIFAQNGEDYFRKIEAETLREWSTASQDYVMGTGGGAPCFFNGMDIINESGLSIFLDVAVDELVSRLAKATDRPLLNAMDEAERKEKLESLRAVRVPVYSKAHLILQDTSLDAVLRAIKLRR